MQLGGTCLLSAMMFLALPSECLAREVNWSGLNLSPQQENQINQLEGNWEKTHEEVSVQIDRDMAELRQILPTGDTQRIRQLQSRITQNKMYLLNQSMDTFLRKRDTLTPVQRQQLQKMMPAKSN
jgi:Spy/CpxP family protein refolding chaperone